MPRTKDPECRGILVEERDAALYVKHPSFNTTWWIPRSQIGYMRKSLREDGRHDIVFTIPEWLIEKKQCWELVP